MTWGEFAQLLTAVVVAAAYIRGELRGRKLTAKVDGVKAHVEQVATTVERVAVETNGMKTELVEEVRKASFAKGVKSETDKQ